MASIRLVLTPSFQMFRFYPGIGMPTPHLIGSGSLSAGSIDAPEDTETSQTAPPDEDDAGLTKSVRGGYRAPLVTGSFNHAVLPVPPVSPRPFPWTA